jgi:ammonium transporter, Amt family
MAIAYFFDGVLLWDVIVTGNGALAGLVSITANCSVIHPWAGIIIGGLGGLLLVGASWFVSHVLKIDDPLDAIAVHGFCGYWGVIATGLFAVRGFVDETYGMDAAGAFFGGGGKILYTELTFIAAHFAWITVTMAPFFFLLKKIGLLRISPEEEMQGVDVSYHGGSAYESGEGGVLVASIKAGKANNDTQSLLSKVDALSAKVAALEAKV